MAQLMYFYGCVGAGKTIEILKTVHNYEQQGKKVLLFTSALDDRTGVGIVSSRIGLQRDAIAISSDMDIVEVYKKEVYSTAKDSYDHVDCILVDEAQFFTKNNILGLAYIVDKYKIPVLCFGLKNDFQNELFEGAKALLTYSDKLIEMKTVCQFCTRKATMNLRINNGKPVYSGEQVQIGGDEAYIPVCRHHYYGDDSQ